MDMIIHDWGSLVLRWIHIITAIAWIGSSFYFMHLDASLRQKATLPKGVYGEAWEVHGGGFYQVQKYLVAPEHLPEELTWHKWQAYSTWLSGFFLLIWVYYMRASLFLIDPAVLDMSPAVGAGVGIAALAIGWLIYDWLCKSKIGENDVVLAAIGFVYVVAMAAVFQHIFSARGAFIHTGALMGTIMTANVFLNIIPNQRKVVALLKAHKEVPAIYGIQAKKRSAHNNYLTLPVLFLMISNHYPLTYSSRFAFVVVGLVLIAGALIRVFYNERHEGKGDKWWAWAVAAACIILAIAISALSVPRLRDDLALDPLPQPAVLASVAPAPQPVVDVVISRCSMCHAAEPVWDGIPVAPKGVRLDAPDVITRNKEEIYLQAVLTRAMPPNNITEVPDAERRVLRDWITGR
jgi:uncharacterized membrane protein